MGQQTLKVYNVGDLGGARRRSARLDRQWVFHSNTAASARGEEARARQQLDKVR